MSWVQILGLLPRDELEVEPGAGDAWAAASSSRGTTMNGVSAAGTTRQVSRSSGMRVIAGHVAQIGTRGEQQGADARVGRRRGGPAEPGGRVQPGVQRVSVPPVNPTEDRAVRI